MNVVLTASVAGQKPGAVLDLDESSARWMVRNGYAVEPEQEAAPQPEGDADAPASEPAAQVPAPEQSAPPRRTSRKPRAAKP